MNWFYLWIRYNSEIRLYQRLYYSELDDNLTSLCVITSCCDRLYVHATAFISDLCHAGFLELMNFFWRKQRKSVTWRYKHSKQVAYLWKYSYYSEICGLMTWVHWSSPLNLLLLWPKSHCGWTKKWGWRAKSELCRGWYRPWESANSENEHRTGKLNQEISSDQNPVMRLLSVHQRDFLFAVIVYVVSFWKAC